MANSTLVITVQSPRSVADLAQFVKDTSSPRLEAASLGGWFERMSAGLESANFDVQTSATAPVRAKQTFTLVYGSLADGTSTCVVGATTLTAKTSPSGAVQFGIGANLAAACANLAACINANTTLNKYCSAAVTATGVVTVTALTPGVIGNFVTITGGTGITAGGATLVSGAGGCETVAANFSRGL